ncbi:hypothetical protein [Escherichia phage NTNC80A]|uniref:Uncharacterized protein n=1 Tax=Escherichia phage NTNC80A TaxID=2970325 RepID=A0A976XLY1_9CAUD|nr:hypothetical protein [Escherichia phage NTNC80A]
MLGVTGQRRASHKSKVAAEVAPLVDLNSIKDIQSYLNQRYLSGKQEGYAVLAKVDGGYSLYVASGSKVSDKWVLMKQGVSEDSSSLELVDVINTNVESLSDTVEVNVTKERTVCVQTPMIDLAGTVVYRQALTANLNITINENGSPGDTVKLKVSIPDLPGTSGGSYYTLDNVLCTAYSENDPVTVNIDVDAANTSSITVSLRKETATDIKLSFLFIWSMPMEVV